MTTSRTKHIDIKYHFLRQEVENNSITCIYLPTEQMLADSLTKAVPLNVLNYARNSFFEIVLPADTASSSSSSVTTDNNTSNRIGQLYDN